MSSWSSWSHDSIVDFEQVNVCWTRILEIMELSERLLPVGPKIYDYFETWCGKINSFMRNVVK